MAPRKREIPPEKIAQARDMYENTTTPIHDIAAFLGIARNTLHNRINEWGWRKRRYDAPVQPDRSLPVPPEPSNYLASARPRESGDPDALPESRVPGNERSEANGAESTPLPAVPTSLVERIAFDPEPIAERTALALRLQTAVERQLDAVDRVLETFRRANPLDAERSARVLASLARTLREIMTLTAPKKSAPDEADDDDDLPRDMDEFRRELARRMDAFASARVGGGVSPDAEAE